jgi:uroporphyrinogen decarboxylase
LPLTQAQLDEHRRIAESLVAEAHRHDGMIPVDLDAFWADQDAAIQNPFSPDNVQCPLGMLMSGECIFDELGIIEDFWKYETDKLWRVAMQKAYNDRAQRIVGRRVLFENVDDFGIEVNGLKYLHDVFEMKRTWHSGSWWLEASADSPDALRALLDRVDALDLRRFILPPDWDQQKAALKAAGAPLPRYGSQRGPVTFATSIMEAEPFLYLLMDEPKLAERLRDTILRVMIAFRDILDAEHDDPAALPHGFAFLDDNCALLTPDLYAFFGFPILQGVFNHCSPNPGDNRYQHSDSAMGHLLPQLGQLQLTGTNFGPTISVEDIRAHLPHAVIYGELAPFTLSRHEEVGIVTEFLRDFELTRAARGLCFTTAGSSNNGSRLTAMRLLMAAIQRYGRYDRSAAVTAASLRGERCGV